jgi:hypothetical protein
MVLNNTAQALHPVQQINRCFMTKVEKKDYFSKNRI